MISISIKLNHPPPREWVEMFHHAMGWTTAFDPPAIDRDLIHGRCRDENVQAFVENVDKRIAKANEDYERDVVPRLKANAAQREKEEQERQRRQKAAQKLIDEHEAGREG